MRNCASTLTLRMRNSDSGPPAYLEPLHARLQGADWVNFRDHHVRAAGFERRGASLSDVSVTAHAGALSGDHDVRGAHDSVRQGVAAPIVVVKLGLGDSVVDVDCREQELAGLLHLVQPVDARGGFLRHALALCDQLLPLGRVLGEPILDDSEHDLEFWVGGGGGVWQSSVLGVGDLGLVALVDQERGVTWSHSAQERRRKCQADGFQSLGAMVSSIAAPPSSTMISGPASSPQSSARSVHHQYSSSVSPFHAKTDAESRAMAEAAWSWVEKMLHEHHRTLAPSAVSVSIRTAVWTVMWRDPVMLVPARGCSAPYSLRQAISPGISTWPLHRAGWVVRATIILTLSAHTDV